MADEQNPVAEPAAAPAQPKGPPPISSVRWSNPKLAQEFADVLAYRQRKGKSKNGSDLIEQMFNYLKKNPWGDFPTGK